MTPDLPEGSNKVVLESTNPCSAPHAGCIKVAVLAIAGLLALVGSRSQTFGIIQGTHAEPGPSLFAMQGGKLISTDDLRLFEEKVFKKANRRLGSAWSSLDNTTSKKKGNHTYNCMTKEKWSKPKQDWCCSHLNLGCPQNPGFNCFTKEMWSKMKQDWCCKNKGLGCNQAPSHSCFTKEAWTTEKAAWCCLHKGLGCASTASPTAS